MNILAVSTLAACCIAGSPAPQPENIIQVDSSFYAVPLQRKSPTSRHTSTVNLDIEQALSNGTKYRIPLSIRIRKEDQQ